jgi:hypothetical protein
MIVDNNLDERKLPSQKLLKDDDYNLMQYQGSESEYYMFLSKK